MPRKGTAGSLDNSAQACEEITGSLEKNHLEGLSGAVPGSQHRLGTVPAPVPTSQIGKIIAQESLASAMEITSSGQHEFRFT